MRMETEILKHNNAEYEVKNGGSHVKLVVFNKDRSQRRVTVSSYGTCKSDKRARLNTYARFRKLLIELGYEFKECKGVITLN